MAVIVAIVFVFLSGALIPGFMHVAHAGIEHVSPEQDVSHAGRAFALHFAVVDPALRLHPEEQPVEQNQPCDGDQNPENDFKQGGLPVSAEMGRAMSGA
jgi:hypothetical protein